MVLRPDGSQAFLLRVAAKDKIAILKVNSNHTNANFLAFLLRVFRALLLCEFLRLERLRQGHGSSIDVLKENLWHVVKTINPKSTTNIAAVEAVAIG